MMSPAAKRRRTEDGGNSGPEEASSANSNAAKLAAIPAVASTVPAPVSAAAPVTAAVTASVATSSNTRRIPSAELTASLLRPLTSWFRNHGCDERVEIEARLRSVSADEWTYMHRKLSSFGGWRLRLDEDTADMRFPGDIRVTSRRDGAVLAAVAKETLAHVDLHLPDGVALRVALAAEDSVPLPRAGAPPLNVRLKSRSRFCLPGGITFDLTRVRLGSTQEAAAAAPVEHEAEVEWCGQAALASRSGGSDAFLPEVLANDFLLKVEDLIGFQRRARHLATEAAGAATAAAAAAAAAPAPAGSAAAAAAAAAVPSASTAASVAATGAQALTERTPMPA